MQRKHNSRIYEHGTSNEEKQNKKDNVMTTSLMTFVNSQAAQATLSGSL